MQECKDRDPRPLEWKEGEGEQKDDEEAIDAAWLTLKPKLGPKNWTASESFTLRGFFAWGWEARKQFIQPEIDALKAENEKLRKDAERYRWLRDPCVDIRPIVKYQRGDYGSAFLTYQSLDEAIDASMTPDTKGE